MRFEEVGSALADNSAVASGAKLNYAEIASQESAKSDSKSRSARDTVAPSDAVADLVFDNCSEKYTYWQDGSMKKENSQTGRGYTSYQPDGTRVTKSWGPEIADNSVATSYPDQSYKVESRDGTGYLSTADGKRTHWGPNKKKTITQSQLTKTETARKST